jgi:hypothetical protein
VKASRHGAGEAHQGGAVGEGADLDGAALDDRVAEADLAVAGQGGHAVPVDGDDGGAVHAVGSRRQPNSAVLHGVAAGAGPRSRRAAAGVGSMGTMPFEFGGGWIEVVAGPMFSGKSEELIRRVTRAMIARQPVQVFKP